MRPVYLLDTSALLCLRDEEPGADRVAALLESAANDEVSCLGCFISQMEVYYRVWKDEGKAAGRKAYEHVLRLPIEWIHESRPMLERAAAVKATQSVSLADAWIAAATLENDAILVHKDPEFRAVAELKQEALPLRALRRSSAKK